MEVPAAALNDVKLLPVLTRDRGYAPYDVLLAYQRENQRLVCTNVVESLSRHLLSLGNVSFQGAIDMYLTFPDLRVRYIAPKQTPYAVVHTTFAAGVCKYAMNEVEIVGSPPPQRGVRTAIQEALGVPRDAVLNRLIDMAIMLTHRN